MIQTKEVLEIIDSSFDSNNLAKYQLSIQFSEETISLCVVDFKNAQIVAFWQSPIQFSPENKNPNFTLSIERCPLPYKGSYRSISLAFYNSFFTCIPSVLFDEDSLVKAIHLNNGELHEVNYLHNTIPYLNLELGYAVPSYLIQQIKTIFPLVKFFHHSSVLLSNFEREIKLLNENHLLFVHLKASLLEIYFFDHGQFKFANVFKIENAEEFLYHLLNCSEQLKVLSNQMRLILLGDIKMGSEFHELAFKYFGKIQMGSGQSKINTGLVFNELPKHVYFSLFHQHLCE